MSTFGKGVDKNIMEEHVTSYGNLLWHLFTWGEVPCLKGEDARKAFDELQYEEAIRYEETKMAVAYNGTSCVYWCGFIIKNHRIVHPFGIKIFINPSCSDQVEN